MIVKNPQLNVRSLDLPKKDCSKVLHLINGEHFAGAERVQDLLASAMPNFGYAIEFASLKQGKFAEVRTSRCQLYSLNMKHSFDLSPVRQIVELAKENEYDLLHAHTPRSLLIGSVVASRLDLPLVYHVHSPVGRDSKRGLRNRINQWVETRCLRSAEALICVSDSLRQYMVGLGHDAAKLHVIHNGVPIVSESSTPTSPGGKCVIGTMALYRPRKGIECLLEAVSKMVQRGFDIELRAVGPFESENYRSEVFKLVDQLGIADRITWTGFQQDINSELQKLNLFVLPSLFGEGLPMVVLESMACGVPVLASNVEGIPEAIRDGVDGYIFEPGSTDDLVAKFLKFDSQPEQWNEFGARARERQRSHFSDHSMATALSGIYDRIMQRH